MDILKSVIVWFVGILFMVVFFPVTLVVWLLVLPFDRKRKITHWMLINQSYLLVSLLPIWKISIEGREKGFKIGECVIISNHQSILDILIVNCLRYRFKWISKIENMNLPILGWYLRMAGYITVDRGNKESKEEMLEKSYRCLREGTSIMMFPEGTRSVDGEIGFFKRGAFQLAISAGVPVLPVIIDGSGGVLPKHGLVFTTGHKIKVRVLDPVLPGSFTTGDPDLLSLEFSELMKKELRNIRSSM